MSKLSRDEVYERLTAGILSQLENGKIPWERPWIESRNLGSGRPYSGANAVLLSVAAQAHGYQSPYWSTFRGAQELGGCVRKGERTTPVVLWKEISVSGKRGEDTEEEEHSAAPGKRKPNTILYATYFNVFNLDQLDGIEPERLPKHVRERVVSTLDPILEAERIVDEMPQKPPIISGGSQAFYHPLADTVHMPPRNAFKSQAGYYGTLFHELAHSTGHSSRLNRPNFSGNSFGDCDYSREELVAEFSSSFLLAEAGIRDAKEFEQSASYCAGWLAALKKDPSMLISAGAQAQKAADFIAGKHAPSQSLAQAVDFEKTPQIAYEGQSLHGRGPASMQRAVQQSFGFTL